MHPNLSFEQAPPISVPYRFFVTAPWFGVAAGLVLAWLGQDALVSRWSPGALAAVHLTVAGFMLQAMCGALLQFVPVAAGGNVWRPRVVAGMVHPLLAAGVICLATGFLSASGGFFVAAAVILGLAVAAYVAVVGSALRRTPGKGPTLAALRFAVAGLAITAALGVTIAASLGTGNLLPVVEMTQVHAAWGLGGWALTLLIGVSYYVVPMFQLTPAYPGKLAWGLPPAIFVVLLAWSWQLVGAAAWEMAVLPAGMAAAASYAVATLRLQQQRRRKVSDPTLHFFRVAMLCLIALAVAGLWTTLDAELGADRRAAVWMGLLAIPGVFVSAISGMLYKIVPFLNWLHLQRLAGLGAAPPNMREMIAESAMIGHLRLHVLAVLALLASVFLPVLTRPAGLLFAASCGWLGINVANGVRAYARFRRSMATKAAAASA
ncbi:MAG TPA: hypothetical protein VF801_12505 [Rhodocyclaceae bacterium]